MDGRRFDAFARGFVVSSRRGFARRLVAALAGVALGAVGSSGSAAGCRAPGRLCREHANCCSGLCRSKDQFGRRRCGCRDDDDCPASGGECLTAVCAEGVCAVDPLPNGAPCGTDFVCQDGACVDPCDGQCLDQVCASTVERTAFCAGLTYCAGCYDCATSADCPADHVCARRLFQFGERLPHPTACAPTFCVTAISCV